MPSRERPVIAQYIPTSALKRVARALPELEPWAVEAIAYHLALERELDAALARLLPRAELLFQCRFGQKISILQAMTVSTWADGLAKGLIAFGTKLPITRESRLISW